MTFLAAFSPCHIERERWRRERALLLAERDFHQAEACRHADAAARHRDRVSYFAGRAAAVAAALSAHEDEEGETIAEAETRITFEASR